MGNWDYKDEAHELGLQLDDQRMQYREMEARLSEEIDELKHENEYLRDQLADRKPVMRSNGNAVKLAVAGCKRMAAK